jgi:hypothetical protein
VVLAAKVEEGLQLLRSIVLWKIRGWVEDQKEKVKDVIGLVLVRQASF